MRASAAATSGSTGNLVQQEQLRRLLAGLPTSVLTSCLLATVLVWVQRSFIPTSTLLGWFVLTLAVGLGRLALGHRAGRRPRQGEQAARTLVVFRLGAVAAGSVWGLSGVLLFPPDNAVQQAFLAFALAGLCTGGLVTGFSAEDVIGRVPDLLDRDHHNEEFVHSLRERLELNRYWAGEVWSRRKDRESHPGWLTISAVNDENGQVTHYVQNFTDISALKAAEDHIHRLAFFDALTELPNRRLLLDRLRKSLELSHRRGSFGAVVFLDLDGFKTLNDLRGHAAGDRLLVEVAQRLKQTVRSSDTVARLGGDEFVVVLEDLGADQAMAASSARSIAEKICTALAEPYVLPDHEHLGSSSLGVSLFRGLDTSVDDLLKHVDVAMYQAKNSGGNAFRFYQPAMLQAIETRSRLLSGLHEAMVQQRMNVALQLRVDRNGVPVGAEARPHWRHVDQPDLSPLEM